jgi:hypothetical protein
MCAIAWAAAQCLWRLRASLPPMLEGHAQVTLKIGWLSVSPHLLADFRERLRQLGHVEGENPVIEYRYADGKAALLPGLVASSSRPASAFS